jgi:aspartyl-tRNA(Asn)/glutamyl-tRNA(Gln) amidotransferase subunit A
VKRFRRLTEVQEALASGALRMPELVRYYLDRIEENKHLNAFIEVWPEEALQRAAEVQVKLDAGSAGRLAGMVIGLKDNICYKGHRVSAASRILEGFESLFSATVTERLLAEDAIFIGRTNCDEFAMGSSNENSAYGLVRNPLNTDRVPGGSSGGSSAAVAADLCLAALGSDTGGSIRQPASLTGIVGFKPTYGRVSRHGLVAYASSFDQIGPMTSSVEDAALLLEIMAGPDEYDSTAIQEAPQEYSKSEMPVGPVRIAYLRECLESPGLNAEVRARMNGIMDALRSEGHTVEPVDFPYLDYIVPAYYVLTTAEASSNLARFDGIHYGYRSARAAGIESTYRMSRSEGFGSEVKRRIMLGTFVLSSGYYDAYYTRAQRVRQVIRRETNRIFDHYDFILTPTSTNEAFGIGDNTKDPIAMYLEDIFTVQANLAGIPAISLPLGMTSGGMPFGVQAMARAGKDAELLGFSARLADQFEVLV